MSTADWPSQGGWASPNRVKARAAQKAHLPAARDNSASRLLLDFICNIGSSWFPSRLPLALNYNSFPSLQFVFLPHQILVLLSRPQCMSQFLPSVSLSLSRHMCVCIHILWVLCPWRTLLKWWRDTPCHFILKSTAQGHSVAETPLQSKSV